jgi:hypothetical protein
MPDAPASPVAAAAPREQDRSFPVRRLRPRIGDIVLDPHGRRCQCIVTPSDRRHAVGATGWLQTRYVFRRSVGVHWCVDEPTGTLVPSSEWTAPERVRATFLIGRDQLFDYVDEVHRRDDLFELALIEAVLGVPNLRDAFDLHDEPDEVRRWEILAREFDRRRPAPEPVDAEAVL